MKTLKYDMTSFRFVLKLKLILDNPADTDEETIHSGHYFLIESKKGDQVLALATKAEDSHTTYDKKGPLRRFIKFEVV
jgi:hypothetical protein